MLGYQDRGHIIGAFYLIWYILFKISAYKLFLINVWAFKILHNEAVMFAFYASDMYESWTLFGSLMGSECQDRKWAVKISLWRLFLVEAV